MIASPAIWVSNESPNVFPSLAADAAGPGGAGLFLLTVNGKPMAWTGPHGQTIDWIGGPVT